MLLIMTQLYILNRDQFGGYHLFLNIEEDYVTNNSNVVFRQLKAPNFIYQDRHGNWIAGLLGFYGFQISLE